MLSGSQVLTTLIAQRNSNITLREYLLNHKWNMKHAAKFWGAIWQGLLSAEHPLRGNFWDFVKEGQFFAFTSNPVVSKNLCTSLVSTQKYHCLWIILNANNFFFLFFLQHHENKAEFPFQSLFRNKCPQLKWKLYF